LDQLDITGLAVSTHIGIHAWEQKIRQRLLLDIGIPMDFTTCENALNNTIDYDQLCLHVTSYLESQSFELIETVAEKVAALLKETFNIATIRVRVSKPGAVKNADNVSVTVSR
jgi:dihydroneopterin aldolase